MYNHCQVSADLNNYLTRITREFEADLERERRLNELTAAIRSSGVDVEDAGFSSAEEMAEDELSLLCRGCDGEGCSCCEFDGESRYQKVLALYEKPVVKVRVLFFDGCKFFGSKLVDYSDHTGDMMRVAAWRLLGDDFVEDGGPHRWREVTSNGIAGRTIHLQVEK